MYSFGFFTLRLWYMRSCRLTATVGYWTLTRPLQLIWRTQILRQSREHANCFSARSLLGRIQMCWHGMLQINVCPNVFVQSHARAYMHVLLVHRSSLLSFLAVTTPTCASVLVPCKCLNKHVLADLYMCAFCLCLTLRLSVCSRGHSAV